LGGVFVTGNIVIDAVDMYFDKVAEVEGRVLGQVGFGEYALVMFHRAENVDDPATLRDFVRILKGCSIPVVFPVHPRTRRRLQEFGLWGELEGLGHVKLLPPQGYFEFLALMKNCRVVLTDSGGLQEEATYPRSESLCSCCAARRRGRRPCSTASRASWARTRLWCWRSWRGCWAAGCGCPSGPLRRR